MKKVLFVAIVFAMFTSCNKEEITDDRLNGTWMLTNISCFCGFDPDTNFNDFTLNFNASEKIVIVLNPREDYFYIANSGTYSFNLTEDTIKINGSDDFKYSVDGDILTLTRVDDPQIADDELTLIYSRK